MNSSFLCENIAGRGFISDGSTVGLENKDRKLLVSELRSKIDENGLITGVRDTKSTDRSIVSDTIVLHLLVNSSTFSEPVFGISFDNVVERCFGYGITSVAPGIKVTVTMEPTGVRLISLIEFRYEVGQLYLSVSFASGLSDNDRLRVIVYHESVPEGDELGEGSSTITGLRNGIS